VRSMVVQGLPVFGLTPLPGAKVIAGATVVASVRVVHEVFAASNISPAGHCTMYIRPNVSH